jgi:hypothetical protein
MASVDLIKKTAAKLLNHQHEQNKNEVKANRCTHEKKPNFAICRRRRERPAAASGRNLELVALHLREVPRCGSAWCRSRAAANAERLRCRRRGAGPKLVGPHLCDFAGVTVTV